MNPSPYPHPCAWCLPMIACSICGTSCMGEHLFQVLSNLDRYPSPISGAASWLSIVRPTTASSKTHAQTWLHTPPPPTHPVHVRIYACLYVSFTCVCEYMFLPASILDSSWTPNTAKLATTHAAARLLLLADADRIGSGSRVRGVVWGYTVVASRTPS